MISHVFVGVGDFDRAMDFYSAVLAALGLQQKFRDPDRNKLCVCCHDAGEAESA